MENFSYNSTLCPATTEVTNVSGFQAMLITEAILSILALFPNALMVFIVIRTRVFHTNLRLLLAQLNVILLAYSAALVFKSVSVLMTVTSGDVCTLPMKLYDCKLREMPAAFPNNALAYASLAVCLERVYCTVRYKHYDKNGAKPWLAIALTLIVWSITLINQLVNLEGASRTKMTPICENLLSVTPAAAISSMVVPVVVEIAIVIISLAVHLYNRHQLNSAFLNRSKLTLSARFQLEQNVKLNRIVTPSFIFEASCYIFPILLLLILINSGHEIAMTTKVLLTHFSYIWKLTFCCLQPAFSFYKNSHLNKSLKKWFEEITPSVFNTKTQVSPALGNAALRQQEDHFRKLAEQWSIPLKPEEQNKRWPRAIIWK